MRKSKGNGTASAMSQQRLQSQQEQRRRREDAAGAIWKPASNRMRLGGAVARARPPTPAPTWKLYENPFYELGQHAAAVSARKLAASLWELQEMPICCQDSRSCSSSGVSSTALAPVASRKNVAASNNPKVHHLTPCSQSPDSTMNGKKMSRQVVAMQAHVNRLVDKHKVAEVAEVINDENQLSILERLDVQSTSSSGVAGALRHELEAARLKAKELENANRVARREIDNLLRKIADERAVSYSKEQDRVKQALQSIKDETEEERKSRRKMELAHRKLRREVGEAKMALSKALQDREKERKARALMEDVCDELAREIGQDKAELEELRRESVRMREEVEEERRMLQIAEVWREERVHMKLLEARLGIEEKVSVLEELRRKLQEFLKSRRRVMDNGDYASQQADIREAETLEEAVQSLIRQERKSSELPQATELLLMDDDGNDPQTAFTRVVTSPVKLMVY